LLGWKAGTVSSQVVDLEGKPVAGATLRVRTIEAAAGEGLGPWLAAVRAKKGPSWELNKRYCRQFTGAVAPTVKTDAAGRFRLTGIGRGRLILAQFDGPTIASQQLRVLTRPGEPITATGSEGNPEDGDPPTVTTYHAAAFRLVVAPTRPIVGVVRDKGTKQLLAGVTVRSYSRTIKPGYFGIVDIVRTTTDADGRYRLTGLPEGEGYRIVAIPGKDRPYLVMNKEVPDPQGPGAVTVDFEMKRGVWIEGKIIDKMTGRPVKAIVEYFARYESPNLCDYPGCDGTALGRVDKSLK
jgi:hypothetical protein